MRFALALTFALLTALTFVPGTVLAEGDATCEPYSSSDNTPVAVQNNGEPAVFVGQQGFMGHWTGTAYPVCTTGLPCVEDPIECLT